MTDSFTAEALKAIDADKDRPFFLYLAYHAPHTPLQSDYDALGDIDDHRERVHGATIKSLDRGVGAVLDKLEAEGLEENTIVVFTSDNGGDGNVVSHRSTRLCADTRRASSKVAFACRCS